LEDDKIYNTTKLSCSYSLSIHSFIPTFHLIPVFSRRRSDFIISNTIHSLILTLPRFFFFFKKKKSTKMQFLIAATLFALMATVSAVAIEEPGMTAIRREVMLLERAGANANRPVATGACCVAGQSLKEDVCTTAGGAAGKCVPASSAGCKFHSPFFPFPFPFCGNG
jgi:hypothetical protein